LFTLSDRFISKKLDVKSIFGVSPKSENTVRLYIKIRLHKKTLLSNLILLVINFHIFCFLV